MKTNTQLLKLPEFIALLALMISIVALATDIMLPALDKIAYDLEEFRPNRAQLTVSSLFAGFSIGQIIMGPLSDSYGRKPIVMASYIIFIVGCMLSLLASDFNTMLLGRVLQGVGASGPRVLSIAIVRDGYEGRAMARIMSVIMSVFIIIPAIAPVLGQGLIVFWGWPSTFLLLLILALITAAWFFVRQPETLASEHKRPFSVRNTGKGIREIFAIRSACAYTLSSGFILGAFLGYLGMAQQIFTVTYAKGPLFALYFGIAALAIGVASMVNSKIVMRLGMRLLCKRAYQILIAVSCLFLLPTYLYQGMPPFGLFMLWLLVTFFCIGMLFGNLNALAMQPLGHFSGLGAAFVGSISTFVSLPFGWLIGHLYQGGITSLVSGFAVLGALALYSIRWAERKV